MNKIKRVICWYSCGVTSTWATKLTIDKYRGIFPIVIAYCDTGSEHLDNKRYLKDCEKLFGQKILVLKNPEYEDIYDVFDKTRYMAGINGARCSLELKKKVREKFENLESDLQIFGFDMKEKKRAKRFKKNNPLVLAEFPLIDAKITKSSCIKNVLKSGIALPTMYLLGYKNNNCIGCVKGAKGYWNKIRIDFPDIFEKTADYEEMLGARLNVITKNGKTQRVLLRELDPNDGNYKSELPITCGFVCE